MWAQSIPPAFLGLKKIAQPFQSETFQKIPLSTFFLISINCPGQCLELNPENKKNIYDSKGSWKLINSLGTLQTKSTSASKDFCFKLGS